MFRRFFALRLIGPNLPSEQQLATVENQWIQSCKWFIDEVICERRVCLCECCWLIKRKVNSIRIRFAYRRALRVCCTSPTRLPNAMQCNSILILKHRSAIPFTEKLYANMNANTSSVQLLLRYLHSPMCAPCKRTASPRQRHATLAFTWIRMSDTDWSVAESNEIADRRRRRRRRRRA